MDTSVFWVGDRPGEAWLFSILDQSTGEPYDLTGYTRVRAILKDSDNREHVFPEQNVLLTTATAGEVSVLWPSQSLFTKPGIYVLQLEFSSPNATRRTSVKEIRVRDLGGVTN